MYYNYLSQNIKLLHIYYIIALLHKYLLYYKYSFQNIIFINKYFK